MPLCHPSSVFCLLSSVFRPLLFGSTHEERRTKHDAQSTTHKARRTKHKARSTKHEAQSTKHKARSTNNMKLTRFEEIESWQRARELTNHIYDATRTEKFSKDFGLRDQISRASVSVMSNIAEGFNSGSRPEFIRFLGYAQRSCSEVQSQLYVALDQGYVNEMLFQTLYELAGKTSTLIGGFIRYLKSTQTKR